jgi:hypothetical protein
MLSSLSRPRYPNAALGIEKNSISAVALQGGRNGFEVRQAATVDIADGVIEPSFVDSNILAPDEFIAATREALEVSGMLSQRRWSVTLPSSSARTAILSLDAEPASKNEMEEVLDWKAEQTFGTPAKDLRLSMQKISPDKDRRSRFFVSAVKLDVIHEFEMHLSAAGVKAGLILPRAVGEANWLIRDKQVGDALLISASTEGFTALVLRTGEPAVVRSVTCDPEEIDDEVYRLVMFYNDRFAGSAGNLARLMVVGPHFAPDRIENIASEALGRSVRVVSAEDVGLNLPGSGLTFSDLAAPAGLAALGFV